MLSTDIIYRTKTASEHDIFVHLLSSKDNFIPSLDVTVNIPGYAKKIAENAVTFEAWQGSELVGLIAAYLNDTENKKGFITNVSVVPGYDGKGIASRLIENCIGFARSNKFNGIVLEVNKANNRAIGLYNKYNFKQTASKGDLTIMTLNLQD